MVRTKNRVRPEAHQSDRADRPKPNRDHLSRRVAEQRHFFWSRRKYRLEAPASVFGRKSFTRLRFLMSRREESASLSLSASLSVIFV